MVSETLYLITDGAPEEVDALREALASVPPGTTLVQLRPRRAQPAREVHEIGRALRAITRRAGARLVVNDRVDVALAIGADGVHLPERGLPIACARRQLGEHAIVGASAHDGDGVAAKIRQGADFLTVSPVFATPSKPGATPLGLVGLRALVYARGGGAAPLFALGGIVRPEQVKEVLGQGAQGVATIRGVLGARSPAAAARAFYEATRP